MINKELKTLTIGIIVLLLFITYVYRYNKMNNIGYEINHTIHGIKFQANNPDMQDFIEISVNGRYKKKYLQDYYMFEGNITIDGEPIRNKGDNIFAFNDDNMSVYQDKIHRGDLFMDNMLSEIGIMILSTKQEGGYEFVYEEGIYIAAPADTRDEAIDLVKKLMPRDLYGIDIK